MNRSLRRILSQMVAIVPAAALGQAIKLANLKVE
jgi:hypothetical protein